MALATIILWVVFVYSALYTTLALEKKGVIQPDDADFIGMASIFFGIAAALSITLTISALVYHVFGVTLQ